MKNKGKPKQHKKHANSTKYWKGQKQLKTRKHKNRKTKEKQKSQRFSKKTHNMKNI